MTTHTRLPATPSIHGRNLSCQRRSRTHLRTRTRATTLRLTLSRSGFRRHRRFGIVPWLADDGGSAVLEASSQIRRPAVSRCGEAGDPRRTNCGSAVLEASSQIRRPAVTLCGGVGDPRRTQNASASPNERGGPGRHKAIQSSTPSRISSELARSSGAYIACARAGRAWNLPGISARRRYETLCLPRPSVRAKKATRSSRNST
jgi:hypothetical protein